MVIAAIHHLLDDPDIDAALKKKVVSSGTAHEALSAEDINHGITAFVLFTNLSGGSVGDIQLYKLLQAYLLDPGKRAALNATLVATHPK